MKIAILGPVTTKTYFGGVAVFDEELAAGFKHNKWEVVLITNQKNADSEKKWCTNSDNKCYLCKKNH